MSDIVWVALIGVAGTVSSAVFTQIAAWRTEKLKIQTRHDERETDVAIQKALRADEVQREQRARQVEAIRGWIRDQLVSGIDIAHLTAAAYAHGPANQHVVMQIGAILAARDAANRRLQGRDQSNGSPSINSTLADVAESAIIASMRELARFDFRFKAPLDALAAFYTTNPMPWNEEQLHQHAALGDDLGRVQQELDEVQASVNRMLEDYLRCD